MRWSYKTVHYELKKDGILGSTFLDESEIELSLNQYGKAGWELVSLLETLDGLIAIFKQPLALHTRTVTASSNQKKKTSPVAKGAMRQQKELDVDVDLSDDADLADEDVAEAILLEDFETDNDTFDHIEKDQPEPGKTPRPPADAGLIRIE